MIYKVGALLIKSSKSKCKFYSHFWKFVEYILLVILIFKFEFYYCLASFENLISELDSKGMWEREVKEVEILRGYLEK